MELMVGAAIGVALAASDGPLSPASLTACTWKVYASPLVRPPTVRLSSVSATSTPVSIQSE